MSKEVDREKLRFVTDEGQCGFARLDVPEQPDNFGSWGYALDVAWEPEAKNSSMKNALVLLYQTVTDTDKRAIPKGIFKKLEDTARDHAKNEVLAGKVFVAFKRSCNPKDKDLTNPQERKNWITYVASQQPKLFKLNAKGERETATVEDFWTGCFVKVIGHCFYQEKFKRFCVAFDYAIRTKEGPRLGGGPIDPEQDELLASVAPKAKDQVDQLLDTVSEGDSDVEELPF
jgi:hypothetical protein